MIWLVLPAGAVLLAAAWFWATLRLRRLGEAATRAREATARGRAAEATRLLRLGGQELRGLGVRLHGQAERIGAGTDGGAGIGPSAELAGIARQLLEIADEFQDRALPDSPTRVLREERLDLLALAAEAVNQAAGLLGPGRRHWRLPEDEPVWLWADRRALRHVLGRVLADALRNTRDGDWIDLALRMTADGPALVIEDEGTGFAAPTPGPGVTLATDSRGIGLRLAVARELMQAHGGRLEIEALPRVGSRVSLIFPADRLRPEATP